ncbi:MAG: protein-L-isoaspartate O-methyltransferase, partial [SAR324 cluster bacterium]|nr:protein-L-isoaspartate O-methyltransferase [SAR324 cluster bacterium]
IIVTAAAQNIPVQLKEQIALDGILLSPVGQSHRCEMLRIHKTPGNQFQTSTHGLFSFLPLL